ncbi:hypothetical protein AB0P45_03925, partial [Streptomyces niveus]
PSTVVHTLPLALAGTGVRVAVWDIAPEWRRSTVRVASSRATSRAPAGRTVRRRARGRLARSGARRRRAGGGAARSKRARVPSA